MNILGSCNENPKKPNSFFQKETTKADNTKKINITKSDLYGSWIMLNEKIEDQIIILEKYSLYNETEIHDGH